MTNYHAALLRLNGHALDGLLIFANILSALEYFTSGSRQLQPLLNSEVVRLFADAIIDSTSSPTKAKSLTYKSLAYVFNSLERTLDDPRIHQDLVDRSPREQLFYGALKFFSRMGNIQLRYQHTPLKYFVGSSIAMYEAIPTSHVGLFPPHVQQFASAMPAAVLQHIGCSIEDLGKIHLALFGLQKEAADRALHLIQYNRSHVQAPINQNDRQAQELGWLLEAVNRNTVSGITKQQLSARLPAGASPALDSLIKIAGREITAHRSLRGTAGFTAGIDGWRLSPLERFPIVKRTTSSSEHYLIPNLRAYLRAFPDLVHFTLLDALKDPFNVYRGYAQEIYLQLMMQRKCPSATMLSEHTYKRGKSEVRGPDLTIIDQRADALVVIESKARKTTADTRFTMDEATFDANCDDVYKALLKLPDKIRDIVSGVGPYAQHVAQVGAFSAPPICVCALGETTYFMTEIVRSRARRDPGHPLAGFPFRFCIMSVEALELAAALAEAHGEPLAKVLANYWDKSDVKDLFDARADDFPGYDKSKTKMFADEFLK